MSTDAMKSICVDLFILQCMRQSLRCFDFKHKIINSISFDFRKVRQTFAYIDLRTVCGHPIGLEHSVCDDIPGVRMRAGARQSPLQLQKRLDCTVTVYTGIIYSYGQVLFHYSQVLTA